MGSSAKKKKEKKKDFLKPKLKVGKTRPKAANLTDTSFKAKCTKPAIVIKQQSISATAPSTAAQFAHHLSMLSSRSDTQRKESLAYLTSTALSRSAPLPQPVSVIIPKIQPLVVDGSNGVRLQLLKLLQSLPAQEISSHVDQLLLYTRAGMTHLAVEIRSSALDVLEWLLQAAGHDVVSCAGGWTKTLKCFVGLLGWQADAGGKWSSQTGASGATNNGRLFVKQLHALASFLRAGLADEAGEHAVSVPCTFPLWHTERHLCLERAHSFRHLNLFGAPRDEDSEMCGDREDRQRVFAMRVRVAVESGVEQALKQAGDVGRAAAVVRRVVSEGMVDFAAEEVQD